MWSSYISDPKQKVELLLSQFDFNQSRGNITLDGRDTYCDRLLSGLAFRTKEVKARLGQFDPHSCTEPITMFPMFLKGVSYALTPELSTVFRSTIRMSRLPDCW